MKVGKYIIMIVFLGLISACSVGVVSQSSGKENIGYLQFVQGSNLSYKKGVTVYIDDNPPFTAKVEKEKRIKIKSTNYTITPGQRNIKVVENNRILYEKELYIVTQETKRIVLP